MKINDTIYYIHNECIKSSKITGIIYNFKYKDKCLIKNKKLYKLYNGEEAEKVYKTFDEVFKAFRYHVGIMKAICDDFFKYRRNKIKYNIKT